MTDRSPKTVTVENPLEAREALFFTLDLLEEWLRSVSPAEEADGDDEVAEAAEALLTDLARQLAPEPALFDAEDLA